METTATTAQPAEDIVTHVELSDIQKAAYEEALKEVEKFKKELETKKYLVDLKAVQVTNLRNFITNDAKWKFMEALGIGEVDKNLSTAVDKHGKVFISAVTLEAIYYYLSKVEGTGQSVDATSIGTVDNYISILKALNAAKNSAAIDNEKLKELEYIATCRAEGLDPENPEIS